MRFANAETGQDIARLLHSAQGDPIVITAPRQSGKTSELLKFAETKYPNSQFAFVCANHEMQRMIIKMHFNMVSIKGLTQDQIQAKRVTMRLLGDKSILRDGEVNPPLMITPDNIQNLRGRKLPVFVDEWNQFTDTTQQSILRCGLFVAAVTS